MQSRSDFEIPKKLEFKYFPNLIDLHTGSDVSVIQNMAVFLKEIATNALKSSEI